MALDEEFFECFYPGLLAGVSALGAGSFEAKTVDRRPDKLGVRAIVFDFRYRLAARPASFLIHVTVRLRRRDGDVPWNPWDPTQPTDWQNIYYCLHYGCPTGEETIFRFDRDQTGHHVHIRPNPNQKPHLPAKDAIPDTTDMDPRKFVAMVSEFRRTNVYPIRKR